MAQKAVALKEEGNRYFTQGDYNQAEACYSQAIVKDPSNPKLFTNRAMARLKLQAWDLVINDSIRSIELEHGNMKGYYYLAQAQLALHRPNEAYCSAMTAYERCVETQSTSTTNVSALVLQTKKLKWEARERERLRGRNGLFRELEDALLKNKRNEMQMLKHRMLDQNGEDEERAEIERSTEAKVEEVRNLFAIADPQNMQRREVPDYLIDSISFAIMHDPVVTKTGNTYDRATLMEHLRRSHTDPLTREPLRLEDLRPNLALKEACAEFLTENGWAVDW